MSSSTSQSLDSDKDIDLVVQDELDSLIDNIVLGLCFETHRAAKQGYLFIDDDDADDSVHAIQRQTGLDVFGEAIVTNGQAKKSQLECICPHCQRNLAASRFAPHLEKCMGMGRNSSRIASKRIASNASGKANGQDSDELEDYDKDSGDTDWNYNHDSKKRKKKEKPNGLLKKATKPNLKNGTRVQT